MTRAAVLPTGFVSLEPPKRSSRRNTAAHTKKALRSFAHTHRKPAACGSVLPFVFASLCRSMKSKMQRPTSRERQRAVQNAQGQITCRSSLATE